MGTKFFSNIVVPLIILLAFTFWNWKEGGVGAVLSGFGLTFKMMLGIAVVLVISFLIAGQASVIIGRHMAEITQFLKGKHGVWGSVGAGVVMPTIGTYPVIQDLWNKGILSYGNLALVLLTGRLLNFQTALFFLPFLGLQLTLLSIAFGGLVIITLLLITKAFNI